MSPTPVSTVFMSAHAASRLLLLNPTVLAVNLPATVVGPEYETPDEMTVMRHEVLERAHIVVVTEPNAPFTDVTTLIGPAETQRETVRTACLCILFFGVGKKK